MDKANLYSQIIDRIFQSKFKSGAHEVAFERVDIEKVAGEQFMAGGVIALHEFAPGEDGVAITAEKHYRLVPPEELTEADPRAYQQGS